MAEIKSKKTEDSVEDYINAIKDVQQKKDCQLIFKMMKKVTKQTPKLWSQGTIGFGDYAYKGKSGREGIWYQTGFAPRKGNISLYFMSGVQNHKSLLIKLGKHKLGVGCLYINSLEDIDTKVLEELIKANVKKIAEKAKV